MLVQIDTTQTAMMPGLQARVLQHLSGAFGRLTPRIDRVALRVEPLPEGQTGTRCCVQLTARGTPPVTATRQAATLSGALSAALAQARALVTGHLQGRPASRFMLL